MKKLLTLSALSVLTMCSPVAAHQNPCGDTKEIISKLYSNYGEQRVAEGFGRSDGIMGLYASEDTGTWTILVTHPSGKSCLLASGKMFQSITPTEDKDEEL